MQANEDWKLPSGIVSNADALRYAQLRRKEVYAAALITLGERSTGLTREEILRIYYDEVAEQSMAAYLAAAE